MAGNTRLRPLTLEVRRLGERRHGIVTRRQILALGYGDRAIEHARAQAILFPLAAGVYCVDRLPTPDAWLQAALDASGPGAVLSHLTASWLWDLRRQDGREGVHVSVPSQAGRTGADWIRIHRCRTDPAQGGDRRRGFPVTSVARTLIDQADLLRPVELERELAAAFRLKRIEPPHLRKALDQAVGRRGRRSLTRILRFKLPELYLTESELERRLFALFARAGLPLPKTQRQLGPHRVDFLWPAQRLVVEADSHAWHDNPEAFESDRARDLELKAARFEVLRVTWHQVVARQDLVVRALRTALAQAR